MRIVLLGTGDTVGTPKIGCECPCCMDALAGGRSRRTRFSILIETEDGRVLIDTGPDLRYQLLKHKISHVDGVIWTHGHYDHYAGFGEFYRVQNRVDVYGLSDTLDYILDYLYFMKPTRHDVSVYEPFRLIGLEFTLLNLPVLWSVTVTRNSSSPAIPPGRFRIAQSRSCGIRTS